MKKNQVKRRESRKMEELKFGKSLISAQSPCFVIAEISHNHQGSLETALKMIDAAAACGVQAVKFQKRNNRALYTKAFYNRPYDNENSYGATYGEHREFLEFGLTEYKQLKAHAEDRQMEFMSTAFDFASVDFLEEIGVSSYKIASGDVTNPHCWNTSPACANRCSSPLERARWMKSAKPAEGSPDSGNQVAEAASCNYVGKIVV